MKENNQKNKGGRPQKYTIDKVLEAIKDTGGIKTEVCKRLGCDRRTVYKYIEKFAEVKEAFYEEEEKVLDMAEGSLFALIQNGETSAIFYYLNNKGKRRGYAPINKNVVTETDTKDQGQKTGVLLAPGLLTEDEWEKAASRK